MGARRVGDSKPPPGRIGRAHEWARRCGLGRWRLRQAWLARLWAASTASARSGLRVASARVPARSDTRAMSGRYATSPSALRRRTVLLQYGGPRLGQRRARYVGGLAERSQVAGDALRRGHESDQLHAPGAVRASDSLDLQMRKRLPSALHLQRRRRGQSHGTSRFSWCAVGRVQSLPPWQSDLLRRLTTLDEV